MAHISIKKRLTNDPEAEPEKKAKLLFSVGEGKKREIGKSVWNNDVLEFYYMVKKNWRAMYNSKELFSALVNGWEKWEPREKRRKDPIRTYWDPNDGEVKMRKKDDGPHKKPWWKLKMKDMIWI